MVPTAAEVVVAVRCRCLPSDCRLAQEAHRPLAVVSRRSLLWQVALRLRWALVLLAVVEWLRVVVVMVQLRALLLQLLGLLLLAGMRVVAARVLRGEVLLLQEAVASSGTLTSMESGPRLRYGRGRGRAQRAIWCGIRWRIR